MIQEEDLLVDGLITELIGNGEASDIASAIELLSEYQRSKTLEQWRGYMASLATKPTETTK